MEAVLLPLYLTVCSSLVNCCGCEAACWGQAVSGWLCIVAEWHAEADEAEVVSVVTAASAFLFRWSVCDAVAAVSCFAFRSHGASVAVRSINSIRATASPNRYTTRDGFAFP